MICHMGLCGAKWITVEDYGGFGPLHVYMSEYISIVFAHKLIVFTLTDMM